MFKSLIALLLLPVTLFANENLKAFPEAGEGMRRHVIDLPEEKNEEDLKVELVVGKFVKVDPVNRFFFAGKLEAEIVKGWGFNKYVLKKFGPMAGTRMAAPGAEKKDRFVALGGEPFLIRYNSKLPVVIYTPEDAEVRWRIWRAGEMKRVGGPGGAG